MKRILAFLLAMVMVLALVACAKTPATDNNTPTDANTPAQDQTDDTKEPADDQTEDNTGDSNLAEIDQKVEKVDDPYGGLQLPLSDGSETFRFFRERSRAFDYFGYTNYEQIPGYIEAEKLTGVKIEWEPVSDFATQFPLMVASGDWADCAASYTGGGQLATYVGDEVLLDLTDYIPTYAKNYMSRRTEDAAIARDTSTDEGLLLCFYNIKQTAQGSWCGLWARADWLEQAGMGAIKTYDDMENFLLWAKDNHSDTLTIPYIFNGTGLDPYLLAGYDLSTNWIVDNGVVKYSPLQPAMKDYVEMMRDWYASGTINDFAFSGERLWFDDYAQGGCAMATAFQQWFDTVYAYALEGDTFDMVAVGCPMIDENHHRRIESSTSPKTRNEALTSYIFTSCKNPELLCQWFDFFYTDAGCMLCDYGIEGESYYYDEDGKATFVDSILHPSKDKGYGYTTAWLEYVIDGIPHYYDWTRELNDGMPESGKAACGIWDEGWVDELTYPNFATRNTKEAETYSSIMSDIETLVNENIPKFIRGDQSMDQWDSFIAQVEAMNVAEAIKIQQDSYDRYMARPVD